MKDHSRLQLSPARRVTSAVDELAIADTARRIWRQKWRIGVIAFLFACLGAVLAQLQTPSYQSRAVVVLDPRAQQLTSGEALIAELEMSTPVIDTQIAMLRSPTLMAQVIADIGAVQMAAYQRQSQINRSRSSWVARGIAALRPTPPIADPQALLPVWTAQAIDGLSVNRLGSSYAIEILATAPNPALAADIANGLAQGYVGDQLAERIATAEQATGWLEAQVVAGRARLATAEQTLQVARTSTLTSNGATPDVVAQQIAIQSAQLVPLRAEAEAAGEYLALIQTSPDAVDHPTAAQLRTQIGVLDQEDANLAATRGANHPDRVAIRSQRAGVISALAQETALAISRARLEADLLSTRVTAQTASLRALEEQFVQMSDAQTSSAELDRQIATQRTDQVALIARLDHARAQIGLQHADARILARAEVTAVPTTPRTTLITAFAGFTGLTIALVLSAILDSLHPGFRRIAQVEMVTGYDVITHMPRAGTTSAQAGLRLLASQPYDGFAERIRQLRTALLSPASALGKAVLITSSEGDEGTTPIALATAQSCARNGYLTLYLDLNTRASTTCERFRLNGKLGLTDHLVGQCTLDEAIHHPEGIDFNVLAPAANDPLLADALTVADIEHLLADLRQRFAVIIIDSPPVLTVPDALIIAPSADALIYLIGAGTTRRTDVMRGLADLERLNVGPTGIVVTGVTVANHRQSGDLV